MRAFASGRSANTVRQGAREDGRAWKMENSRFKFLSRITADKRLPELPRVGLTMMLKPGFERFAWFGRGPYENYCDRKACTPVGLYQSTVDEQFVPYVMPQEHGNHTDVRWLMLTDKTGAGLHVTGRPLMEASASHFTAQDLFKAMHTVELERRNEIVLNLDHKQSGIGGASCGPGTLPQYRIKPGVFKFSFVLRPLAPHPGRKK